jgi:thioester reductase-like protein
MTGTSGALGGTILRRLCGEPSVERVYALAHETPVVVADEKIRVIRGAVTSGPSLGLSDHDARQVAADATAVLHAAARTTFNAPLSRLRATNVVGTANVTAFANSLSRVDRVCVLSTVYVAGRRTGLVRESDLSGASGFVNAYEQSKFEMEEWLLAHAAACRCAAQHCGRAVDGRKR